MRLKAAGINFINNLPFISRLYLLIRQLGTPPDRWCRFLVYKGEFRVAVDQKAGFTLTNNPRLYGSLFWRGLYDPHQGQLMKIWTALCRESDVIFDVGANVGIFSLVAASVNPQARLFSFEPVQSTYEELVANLRRNSFDQAMPMRTLVGEKNGSQEIYFNENEFLTASVKRGNRARSEVVSMMTLDSFSETQEIGSVDLVKIDVETAEPQVIAGMKRLLERGDPTLIVEVLNDDVGQAIEALFEGKTYHFYLIDEENGPVKQERIRRRSQHSRDYLLCSQVTAEKLRLPLSISE